MASTLHWQCLPTNCSSKQPLLQPRARHAAFSLAALQPGQQPLISLQQHLAGSNLQSLLRHMENTSHAGHHGASFDDDGSFTKVAGGVPHDVSTPACAMPAQQPQFPAGLVGCVVVFGGVAAGGSWLTDVNLVMVTNNDSGVTDPADWGLSSSKSEAMCGLNYRVQPLPMSTASASQQQQQQHRIRESEHGLGRKPQPVVDFAACECGPSGFVVVGGFDGKEASMQIQRCTTTQAHNTSSSSSKQSAAAAASHDTPEDAPAAVRNHAHHGDHRVQQQQPQQSPEAAWAASWECIWDVLVPHTRSPVGRCHHSCCWHAPSRSLVAFGGYTDRQGCLNDVAVFSMDHCEWWQPQCTGAYAL